MPEQITQAVTVLQQGGVIAYPTEHCFGLGCDPENSDALRRILTIKGREAKQGVILIASDTEQVERYADMDSSPMLEHIKQSWPGPVSWVMPAHSFVSALIRGEHQTVAMRISAHPIAHQLCAQFGAPIVSTSANRHGDAPLIKANQVETQLGEEIDFILAASVGGDMTPSSIMDGFSGEKIR